MVVKRIKDFNLGQICDSGQCFRMYRADSNDREEFVVVALDKYLQMYQIDDEIFFDCDEEEYEAFWKHYFDLDTDYGKIKELIDDEDMFLKQAVDKGWGIRILNQDLWEMIVTFLISQQNNIPRIHKCIDNICQKYGEKISGTEYYSFPTPESLANLEEDALMECNLGYRSKYVVRTARQLCEHKFDLNDIKNMDYKSAREELLKMYGVGNKVADCICLFALHHLDAFPVDTHIKQVLEREYADGFDFERYSLYSGVIQQYIFYYELKK